jgi:hypothetical protein
VGRGTALLSYTGQLLQVGLIWTKPSSLWKKGHHPWFKLSLHDKKLIKKELTKKTCCTIHIAFLHITAKLSIVIIVINPERATADCYVVRREEVFRFV